MAYGLRPVSHGGYLYNTGGNEVFPVNSSTTAVIGHGDLVKLVAGGGVDLATATPEYAELIEGDVTLPVQVLGVFVGCEYVSTSGTPTWAQHWPGSAAVDTGETMLAYVVTDPNAVFMVSTGDSVAKKWEDTYIGNTFDLFNLSSASTATGNSGITIQDLATTAAPAAVRVIGVPKDGKNETSSVTTPDVLVRWADSSVLTYGYGLGL